MDADLAEKLHRRMHCTESMESSSTNETAISEALDSSLLASLANYDSSRSMDYHSYSASTEFSRQQLQNLMNIFNQ